MLSFTINSSTQISATVAGGLSGDVAITNQLGTGSLPGFIFIMPAAPVITSFAPENGPIGTIVTITGNNFNALSSGNEVYFGKVKATILSSSAGQITCAVPPGSSFEPIIVINTINSLVGYSRKPFSVTFPGGPMTQNTFTDVLNLPTDPVVSFDIFPVYVTAGDIDGDGKNDIISSVRYYSVADSVFLYRNNTVSNNISFESRKTIGNGYNIATGDIDGDGKLDIAFINNYNVINILRNTSTPGNISFAPVINIPLTNNPRRLIINDLDGDGRAEIIYSGYASSTLCVLRNISIGSSIAFAPLLEFPTAFNAINLAVGDLSGDGKPDIIINGKNSSTALICVFKNTSTVQNVSFAPRIELPVIGGLDFSGIGTSSKLFIADINSDGKLDILVNTSAASNPPNPAPAFSIFKNTSSGNIISFDTRQDFNTPDLSITAELSNFDGDSLPDFISGNYYSHAFNFHKNTSTASAVDFTYLNYYGASGDDWAECASDLDNDGKPDVIVATAFQVPASNRGFHIYKNGVGSPVNFSLCAGGNTTITTDVTGTSYQWEVNTGAGFINLTNNANISGAQTSVLSFTNIPFAWNGYQYRCLAGSSYSSIFLLHVNGVLLPDVTISTPANAICYGTPVTFTASGINGGTAPSYKWQVNSVTVGTNSPTFNSSVLNNNDTVRVIYTSSDACSNYPSDTSNVIIMAVTGSAPIATIATAFNPVCDGSSVSFTATLTGGTAVSYQWKVNGINAGTNSPVFTTASLANGNQVSVLVTANLVCGTTVTVASNNIVMLITPKLVPQVSIAASSTGICTGSSVTFTATPVNGGVSPSYQWQVNGANSGTNSGVFTSATLNNNDQVKVIMTSNATCITQATATSNIITITVSSPVTPAVTINTASTTVCAGSTVSFTAIPTNGGNAPAYQWKKNGSNVGTNSNTYNNNSFATGDVISVTLTSNANCVSTTTANSNNIVLTVTPLVLPGISIAGNTTVTLGTPAIITSLINNGGTAPVYQWQDSTKIHNWLNIAGGNTVILNYSPSGSGDRLRCLLSSNIACVAAATVNSNVLQFIVDTPLHPISGKISYYPNPVTSKLTIDSLILSMGWETLTIVDATGTQVSAAQSITGQTKVVINLANLPAGVYLAVLRNKYGETTSLKFIKI